MLVAGANVTEVTSVDLALALNTDCTNCQTLAAAYQYVAQNDTRVRITGQGRQTIASQRQQLNTLRLKDLIIEEIAAEADRIALEFCEALMNEVVPIGKLSGEPPTPTTTASADASPADPASIDTVSPTGSPSPDDSAPPTDSSSPSDAGSPKVDPSSSQSPSGSWALPTAQTTSATPSSSP